MKKETNKSNVSVNVESTEKSNVSVNNSNLVRKYKDLDYANMTKRQQGQFREKRRKALFNIIDSYILASKGQKKDFDKKANFESFKNLILTNYNCPLSDCESVFKGQSENQRKQYFAAYIQDFKLYLNGKVK